MGCFLWPCGASCVTINGYTNDADIANVFANHFRKVHYQSGDNLAAVEPIFSRQNGIELSKNFGQLHVAGVLKTLAVKRLGPFWGHPKTYIINRTY